MAAWSRKSRDNLAGPVWVCWELGSEKVEGQTDRVPCCRGSELHLACSDACLRPPRSMHVQCFSVPSVAFWSLAVSAICLFVSTGGRAVSQGPTRSVSLVSKSLRLRKAYERQRRLHHAPTAHGAAGTLARCSDTLRRPDGRPQSPQRPRRRSKHADRQGCTRPQKLGGVRDARAAGSQEAAAGCAGCGPVVASWHAEPDQRQMQDT